MGGLHAKMWTMGQTGEPPLGYLLRRLAMLLRPRVTEALGPLGLGLSEFAFLRILALHPGRTSAELARDTHVTAQAANQLLHRLEALGAVSRPVTPASGRSLPAELTPEGQSLLARAERAVEKVDDHVLAGLTPAQQRQLKGLLAKAVGNQARTGCDPIVMSDPPQ